METKSKGGRPRKDESASVRRGKIVQMRVARAQYPSFKEAASAEGLPVAAWLRRLAIRAVRAQKRSA